jgi:hypothetical protein
LSTISTNPIDHNAPQQEPVELISENQNLQQNDYLGGADFNHADAEEPAAHSQ